MNKEAPFESNALINKDNTTEKDKNISNICSMNERDIVDTRMISNIINLQNSAIKNLKNEIKQESAHAFK